MHSSACNRTRSAHLVSLRKVHVNTGRGVVARNAYAWRTVPPFQPVLRASEQSFQGVSEDIEVGMKGAQTNAEAASDTRQYQPTLLLQRPYIA